MNRKKYKITLIEPSPIVTEGLKKIFQTLPEFEILHCSEDLFHFSEHPTASLPDIVILNPIVMDFHRQHAIKSIFSQYSQTLFIALLYHYVYADNLKQYDGMISIYDDGTKINKKLQQAIEHQEATPGSSNNYELSDRETEILISVVKGLQNKEIADQHHISIHTVISHRKNISRKTGIKSIAGLTVYALLHNLLDQNEIE
ncbi:MULTISPECIES: response regulator transcription factor [Sanguibacteroides]|uniref:HTH luxR-type domain-containing protein n=1 Tax=Sanguibacteroides justesenii TaxID=1547597 RepID=A0AB34R473_9PORP|nr:MULTISPECIES: response regulator transcription factor [Sanguibacteroides]KIO43580.1 hypothetical protein IE90_10680 [Sanguibacteroides justesenii]PXZ45164.1 DNA-binding response regulator [Sanguibacteroides justesenii]